MYRALVLTLFLIGFTPQLTFAQLPETSHWGIGASFTPKWESAEEIRKLFIEGEGEFDGKEFTIGVVRGSASGGDWGVSFVRKSVDKDSVIVDQEDFEPEPCQSQFCSFASTSQTTVMQDVYMNGVEFNWSKPFVTIADRVQIGMNLGGGVASVKGTVEDTLTFESVTIINGQTTRNVNSDTTIVPAKEVLLSVWPLGKVEAQVGFIVTPAFKIKASVGLNFPSQVAFRVGGLFLFGSN